MLPHRYFENILFTERDIIGYVIGETIKSALMFGADHLAVDRDFGVGHHTVENDRDLLAAITGGKREGVPIDTLLAAGTFQPFHHTAVAVLVFVPTAVGIFAKSLQLPLRGDFDFFPLTAVAAPRYNRSPTFRCDRNPVPER